MNLRILKKYPKIHDIVSIAIFIVIVIFGTLLINSFIFKTFNVVGPSMEPTMHTDDRLIINRIPTTISKIQNKTFLPEYGQVIVFKNPRFELTGRDEFIIKRVIGLPGDRVVLDNGKYTVYNAMHPEGFDPDEKHKQTIKSPTEGQVDMIVPNGEIFVSGDNRVGANSFDSRSGLGTIPLYDVIGIVSIRIFPFNKIEIF